MAHDFAERDVTLEIVGSSLTASARKERAHHLLALVGLTGLKTNDPLSYQVVCAKGRRYVGH